jgi:PIN domain nuclease of toxin-antitoxin system
LIGGRGLLGEEARRVVLSREHTVAVSAVTIWEIEIKRELGKLEAPTDLVDQLSTHGFLELPIEWEHAVTAGRLPPHHRDPFDRMLIAQALIEDLVLLTADEQIGRYDVPTMDARA